MDPDIAAIPESPPARIVSTGRVSSGGSHPPADCCAPLDAPVNTSANAAVVEKDFLNIINSE
jgi:hypothetical protein